jgi:phosphomannomutase
MVFCLLVLIWIQQTFPFIRSFLPSQSLLNRFYPQMSKVLVLFDVDGTLTLPREKASGEMHAFLQLLRKRVAVGIVGGSDLAKQQEQMSERIIEEVNYSFSENGLVAYKDGALIAKRSLSEFLGETNIKRIVNFALRYIANLDIPVKRYENLLSMT